MKLTNSCKCFTKRSFGTFFERSFPCPRPMLPTSSFIFLIFQNFFEFLSNLRARNLFLIPKHSIYSLQSSYIRLYRTISYDTITAITHTNNNFKFPKIYRWRNRLQYFIRFHLTFADICGHLSTDLTFHLGSYSRPHDTTRYSIKYIFPRRYIQFYFINLRWRRNKSNRIDTMSKKS